MNTQTVRRKPSAHAAGNGKRLPLVRIVGAFVLVLLVICIALWSLVLLNSGNLLVDVPNQTATVRAERNLSCQQLVQQAMQESDEFCRNMGTNQLCYGHFAVEAELIQQTNAVFSQRGDIINVDVLHRLSASPLDLVTQTWGIAVFKVTANLPRSLPGQNVTVLVFGNTTLDKDQPGLHTFYFFSDTGQIICDEVPFDGLFIVMPDGTGAVFNINGSELVLSGTSSITATRGGEMTISLYSGSAQVTANGQTQIFGPGQQVSIPLGGANGTEAVGPPSQPVPLSDEELALACTMSGENCEKEPIPTLSMTELAGTIEYELGTATVVETPPTATSTAQATATPFSSPTSFPTATLAPPRTPTQLPTWTNTPKPPTPTNTPEETEETCNISMGSISFSVRQVSADITNLGGGQIRLAQLIASWEAFAGQSVTSITLGGEEIWAGNASVSPSTHPLNGNTDPASYQIANNQTKTFAVNFSEPLASGSYNLSITFENGCATSQSGSP
jgi:hypothetical protein